MAPTTKNKRTGIKAKVVLLVVTLLLTLLVVEGALSLFSGVSLRDRIKGQTERYLPSDQDRIAAAAALPGEYRSHPDPLVSYYMKMLEGYKTHRAEASTDLLGLRSRLRPMPEGDAFCIAVLGDSVAFGTGLNDDEVISNQLEAILDPMRDPAFPPIICKTVAAPGWNHANAIRFLINHFDAIDPDVVVYMPVSNDLVDSFGVTEAGHRRLKPDYFSPYPLLSINIESNDLFQHYFRQAVIKGLKSAMISGEEIGPFALNCDLSPTSRRRYDANVDSIELLSRFLHAQGRHLRILHHAEDLIHTGYAWILRERMLDRGLRIPEIAGLTKLQKYHTLDGNPHPNADTARALAIWIAEGMIADNLITLAEGRTLPEVPAVAKKSKAVPRSEAEIRGFAAEFREESLAKLQSTVDTSTARGFHQVFGGLNPDGTMGIRFLTLLKPKGPNLTVRLSALQKKPCLYPLRLEVEVNGIPVGLLTVHHGTEENPDEGRFTLPQEIDIEKPLEVALLPEWWSMTQFKKRSFIASTMLHSISSH